MSRERTSILAMVPLAATALPVEEHATFPDRKRQFNRAGLAWLVVALSTLFLMPSAYGAADIYVTPDGSDPAGASWAQPTSLTNALAIATTSNVIWMTGGSYTDASTFTISTDGLQLYGGFDGTETNLSERDWANHVVLLDGEDAHRVVHIQANDVLLDGLVITNGLRQEGNSTEYGAGMAMTSGVQNLTMLNCKVVDNELKPPSGGNKFGFGAGANFKDAGNVLLSNCVFRANVCHQRGSGIGLYSRGSTLTILDCEIRENYDNGGDQRDGKGFCLYNGTLTMVGSTVADNSTTSADGNSGKGCGGYVSSGTASFTNCVFTGNNSANSTGGDGGGLYVNNGNVTIVNCTFADNVVRTDSTGADGGAIYQANGTVTIKNSIFWDNQAGDDGDTIYQNSGTLNISYSCMDGMGLPRVRHVNGTWGDGIITNDPLFAAEYTDLHLKSTVGRWDGSNWVTDAVSSPCIDAGDPASAYDNEPDGADGAMINMGAYGNTWQASKSANDAPAVETQSARVVATAAELNGVLTTGAVSTVMFYYGLADQGTTAAGWDGTNVLSEGQPVGNVFSSVAGGLQANQTYWFRAYATNAFGEGWGDAVSFTTGPAAPGGGPGVIHVDADAVGVPDGLSWTNAFTAFEDALAAADAGWGTNMWVAEGTYAGSATFSIGADGLSAYGGFAGTETNLAQRDWASRKTLLDGEALRGVLDIQADDVLLDGLIITNGLTTSSDSTVYGGGGVTMSGGAQDLTMLNCHVVGNRIAPGNNCRGVGACFRNAGNILLSNCVFGANWTTTRGHGIGFWVEGSTAVTVLNSEIVENYDTGGDQRDGKAFYLSSGTLTMVGCTVADNYTNDDDNNSGKGAGGYINGGTASFTHCVFRGNKSTNNIAGDGGGLYINNGNVAIENCTFADNVVDTNSAASQGGAIYQNNGTVTIKNSIFWDNQAGTGGAGDTIYQVAGALNASYSCMDGTETPRVVLVNGTWGDGIITDDPLFAVEYTDLHLKSTGGRWDESGWVRDAVTSPCIDAGDPASDYSREASQNGGRINMGAYGNTAEASLTGTMGALLIVR